MNRWSKNGIHWPQTEARQYARRVTVTDLWAALGIPGAPTGALQSDLQALCDQAAQVNAALAVLTERAERLAGELQRERAERQRLAHHAAHERVTLLPLPRGQDAPPRQRHDRW